MVTNETIFSSAIVVTSNDLRDIILSLPRTNGISLNSCLVAFNMFPQFVASGLQFTVPKCINQTLVTFDAGLPFSLLHTLSKTLKEKIEQIVERNQRL